MASTFLAFAPFGITQEVGKPSAGGGIVSIQVIRSSLLQHEGPSVLVPLSVPIAAAVLGLAGNRIFSRTQTVAAAGLLVAFSMVGALSIGIYYLPSAIAMVVAAVRTEARFHGLAS